MTDQLTRPVSEMIVQRMKADDEFRRGLLCEAAGLIANGECEPAKFLIGDCIVAMDAEDHVAAALGQAKTETKNVFSPEGHPTLTDLSTALGCLRKIEGIVFEVREQTPELVA